MILKSAAFRWMAGACLMMCILTFARRQLIKSDAGQAPKADQVLKVGFLPVTCHLTCPVTDFATRLSRRVRFVAQRFSDFPTVVESLKGGALQATFITVPLAIKLRAQGLPVKILYLGHRDGSTVIVGKNSDIHSLGDLVGKTFAIPNRASNQYLVIRKLMQDKHLDRDALKFVELPPPDMPGALAAGAIDAYFIGEPHAGKAEMDGTGRVLYFAKDIWPGFISCALVVHEDLIRKHPAVVADLVRGIASSGEWAETHRLEAAKLSAPYFRQNESLVRFVLTQPPDRVSYRRLRPTQEEINKIQQIMVEEGLINHPVPINELLDTQFIPDIIQPAQIGEISSAGL